LINPVNATRCDCGYSFLDGTMGANLGYRLTKAGPSMEAGLACPRCHDAAVSKPSFTWWGGFVGPKLIDHRKCSRCGFSFNPRTGEAITSAIIIYSVVAGVFALLVFVMMFRMMHH
jgi:hypothetical protein